MDQGAAPEGRVTDTPAAIETVGLVKRFGEVVAVNDVSLRVKEGEVFGFLGPNGAGKSSMIKMLTTLSRPTEGYIRLHGLDPEKDALAVRRSFGIIFQDPSLDEQMTAAENMELHGVLYDIPSDVLRARTEALLRFVDLWDRRGKIVQTFSGGMKRRLEIARGLLHTPRLLFLDEPTLGLDTQTRNQMWGYLRDMNKTEGTTIFFTTHYLDEAERAADRVAIIDHGKIIALGSPTEIKAGLGAETLEAAFLSLTGHAIREEEASPMDRMRGMMRGRRPSRS